MDDLLKEAIADAKAVRETALENAKIALEDIVNIMRTPPTWAPSLPLDAEGAYGDHYAK